MAVFLSPVGGVAAQFFTNTGAVLTGGKLYTYLAGTTTPAATYTSAAGATFNTNPIVLDAAGRVPGSGEIWLGEGVQYKFVLKDSNDVLIGTYDNVTGINSNFVNYNALEEIQVATAGQTVFNLTNSYQPGTNTLSVFVDGVNQYDGSSYSYTETSSTRVTFTQGLHVGALVKFTTAVTLSAGVVSSNLVTYLPAGTGAVATTVQAKLRQYVSVFDFMTTTQIADVQANTASVDVTTAIQAAITASNDVYFPAGTYSVNAQINLKSGLILSGTPSSIIKLASAVTPYVFRGDSLSNIVLKNITILGNGISGNSTVYISNSSNVLVENCKITKSGSNGLWFVGCSFVKVENCELSNNYYYGLEFRDCDGCKAIANLCYGNGDTGVATSTGGRGIMLWRTRGSYVAGNRLVANTEYGFRIYSEAADSSTSYGNVITGNYFRDNVRSDFVLYDESLTGSLVYRNVISENIVVRSTNTTLGTVYTLHGGQNTYVNNHAYKDGAFGTDAAFLFYYNFDTTVIGCSAARFQQAFSFSGSERVTLQNCLGNGVAQAVTSELKNITVENCSFIHGGTGTTDVAINNASTATGKNWYEGNYFDGFYIGIRIGDEAVALFRNTTVNCTTGLKKDGNVLANLESGQNSWNVCDPSLLSSLNKTISADDRKQLFYSGYPTILTWAVGDVVTNNAPIVGQPKGWMCTVAGTPGTWVSMGNL